jgi:hypothetical protein
MAAAVTWEQAAAALESGGAPAVICAATHPFAIVDVNRPWLATCGFPRAEVHTGGTPHFLGGRGRLRSAVESSLGSVALLPALC